jgi:LuxR family maltose regulon positive regulatory protein
LAATQLLGEVFYWQGNHEQAKQTCYQIIAEAVGDDSMLDDQGLAAMGLANVAYELNDLAAAEQQARHALQLARQRSNASLEAQAIIRVALVDAARGAFSQAQEQLKTFVAVLPNGMALRDMQCVQAQVALMAGEVESLEWWRTMVTGEKHRLLPMQREREVFTLARLYLAEGKPDEALGLLDRWQTEAAQHGRVRSQVEASCIEALAFQAAGNLAQAAQTLAQMLAAAEEKRFCRLIVDYGAPMACLLREAIPLLTHRPSLLYATTLLHSFAPEMVSARETAPGGRLLVEPLSQQEVRVRRLLAAGLSNADIARELVVSTNTVKTHVKSIYRKLDINSRSEVRLMVKELKLV